MKGCVFLLFAGYSLVAQPSLKVDKGVVFQLTGDSFSIDSLIMADSSALLLDNRHSTNLLRANFVSIGTGCILSGAGKNGENGPPGSDGSTALYAAGKAGRGGFSAVNLVLNFYRIHIESEFQILLIGGSGGNGGIGGNTTQSLSGISPVPNSTRYNGTQQGVPGDGGDGGRGGNVTLSFPVEFRELVIQKIKIINTGGDGGVPAVTNAAIPTRILGSTPAKSGKHGARGKVEFLFLKK